MALSDFLKPFAMQNWISEPDGLGGIIWHWEDGAPFDGGLVLDSSTEMKIAHQNGTRNVYTLTTYATVQFEPGDMVKRLSDGALFRITSHSPDKIAPATAGIQTAEVTCERVEV